MQKLHNIKYKKYLINFFLIIFIFALDRLSKVYLLNLQEGGTDVDFYLFPFLNIYLVWNTGIGFGLFPAEVGFFYHFITFIIIIINLVLIFFLFKFDIIRSYFIAIILGGSFGNLFDRLYYFAVPDFIDLHIGSFHWFIFNVADIFITFGVICLIFAEILIKDNYKEKNS